MSDNNNISSWLKAGAVAGFIGVAAAAGMALYEEYTKQQQEEEALRNKLRQSAVVSNFRPSVGFDRPRNLSSDSTPGVCVICQENENIRPILTLTCGHRFHSKCIHDAYEKSDLCPICRQSFTL